MSNFKSLAMMAAAATLLPFALGTFDASSNSNVAIYWGQGPYQKPLSHFCADPNIDIINIGFLNKFPDQTKGYPGTNFGNQCGNETYKNKDGSESPFLSDCPSIGPDIITCQNAGKKVFLSLGGAIPSNQSIKNDTSAQAFATTLWTSFGPKTDPTAPRPFGDAVVDGFDLDIESVLVEGEGVGDLSMGYSSLVNDLRAYFLSSDKTFYISGAPQCIIPDAHLADAIETSFFDFLFVQFYNTPECSARAYFDHNYGGANVNISYSKWVDFVHNNGANKKTKVYLGLPASNDKNNVISPEMYLEPNEAKEILQAFQSQYPDDFGGVMLYEATSSETNSINGKPYADVLKKDLTEGASSNQQSTSSSAPNTQATSSADQFPSIPPNSLLFGLAPPSSSGAPFPIPSGSAPPSSAPYPISSGSAPFSGPTGSSAGVVPSGSAPSKSGTAPYTIKTGTGSYSVQTGTGSFTIKTGTAPYTVKTGTAPYSIKTGTAASASVTVVSSGASSGSLTSGYGSSNAPYPVSNSSAPISTGGSFSPTTSGEEVVTVTDVKTITSCGPEVTNCPAKTHPVLSTETHLSTISPGSSGSAPAGGSSSVGSTPGNSPQSSEGALTSPLVPAGGASGAPSVSSTLGNSPQSTQEVVTTEIVTSYLTTCPVTSTATSGGSQIIETGSTVSTVYSTIISTICTKCVAPPTPAPTQKASPSAPVSQSQSPFTGKISPSASIQEVVTTVVEFTTLTTCPVTNTITSGTSEIVQVTQSVSTITSTTISTICTKCVAPPTGVPVPGSGAYGPSSTAIAGIPGSGHQGPPLPMPAGPSPENSSPGSSSPSNSSPGNSLPGSSKSGNSSPGGSFPSNSSPGNSSPGSSSPGNSSPGNSSPGSSSPGSSSPSKSSPGNSSPAGSVPAGSSSPSHEVESGAQGGNVPSSSGNSGSSGSSLASHGLESPAGSISTPSKAETPGSPASAVHNSTPAGNTPASPESQSGTQGGNQPAAPASQAPAASPAGGSAAGTHAIQSTVNFVPVQTLTIVPIPVSPTQTAVPKKPIESGQEASNVPSKGVPASGNSGSSTPGSGASANSAAGSSGAPGSAAPFPASNGTTPASSTGSSSPSSGPIRPSVEAFKGAASRMDAGVLGIVSFVVAAVLIL